MALLARQLEAGYSGSPRVLQGIDMDVMRGRFVCLLGPNGAGKSTLLRCLAGLQPFQGGQITLENRPLHAFSGRQRAKRIGFLPQEIQPAFSFRVDEAVALGTRVAGHSRWFDRSLPAETQTGIERALRRVDALDLLQRRLETLSGGERRRVLIASVLAQEPQYLLLDEPTAMLDLHHQSQLFHMLRELSEEGLGVLCVTHDLNLAAQFAHQMILLHTGSIHAQGEPAEVLNDTNLKPLFGTHYRLLHQEDDIPVVLPKS